jgi:hypothetical protein
MMVSVSGLALELLMAVMQGQTELMAVTLLEGCILTDRYMMHSLEEELASVLEVVILTLPILMEHS